MRGEASPEALRPAAPTTATLVSLERPSRPSTLLLRLPQRPQMSIRSATALDLRPRQSEVVLGPARLRQGQPRISPSWFLR